MKKKIRSVKRWFYRNRYIVFGATIAVVYCIVDEKSKNKDIKRMDKRFKKCGYLKLDDFGTVGKELRYIGVKPDAKVKNFSINYD